MSDTRTHDEDEIKVTDRRHWARDDAGDGSATENDGSGSTHEPEEDASRLPTMLEEYRSRAEAAEHKLHEYIGAFKVAREEQDRARERLRRDVDRRVQLQFAGLVEALLETVDHLDLALAHAGDGDGAQALAEGVAMVRDRFLKTLEGHGIERLEPLGDAFDPNTAEAVRVDPVDDDEKNGTVTEILRPGYRLGEHVVRAARVAVGKRG